MIKEGSDYYNLTMPSGQRMELNVETPISAQDREWLHALVDLIFVADQQKQPPKKE